MKRWALLVAALYGAILVILTWPVAMAAFLPIRPAEVARVYVAWPYWAWVGVMFACQAALLAVPVKIESRRPVTRGALWPTVLVAGLMAACLVAGTAWSIIEFLLLDHSKPWTGWLPFALAGLAWLVWTVIFLRMGRVTGPADLVSRQCRALLRGSILELLVAVPTHIVARYRNYCCAGLMTFLGLAAGISVMLFSFGPSVFFLYADRWRQLHPEAQETTDSQPPDNHNQ